MVEPRGGVEFLSIFFKYFFTFQINRIGNFRIKSNEFQTNSFSENLTSPYSWSQIERIEFELIFIKFFEYFSPFQINQIANF